MEKLGAIVASGIRESKNVEWAVEIKGGHSWYVEA